MPRYLRHLSGTTQLLQRNARFQFALRHTMEIYESDAIYSFIPKNGCSTLRYSVGRANGTIRSAEDIHWIHANNGTFNASLKSLQKAKYTFVILRCPFGRLASLFLDKFVSQSPDAHQLWSALGRDYDPFSLTFRQFITYLKKRPLQSLNIHWRPQVDFLIYEEYDDYFKFEDFASLSTSLKQKIGLDVVDARELTNHGTDRYEKSDHNESSADKTLLEHLNLKMTANQVAAPESLFDTDIISDIELLYKQDLAIYRSHFGTSELMDVLESNKKVE